LKIVDPANSIPKYLQIKAWLKDLIQTGRYALGEKLPSEIELARMCEVNRNTLRQALAELSAEGILRKEKGSGTFVESVEPQALKHRLQQISSFSDDLKESGIRGKTRIIHKGIQKADRRLMQTLMLGNNNLVVVVRRLRTGNDIPLLYEESYLPADMFNDILKMDLTHSMYTILSEQLNAVLARSEQTLRAVNLRGRIAKLLNVPLNSAGIFMESLTFNENSIPIEVLYSYYRGDKYVFEVELGRYHLKEDTRFSQIKT